MDKVFKVSGREDVLGRLRNIYVKITKKAGVAQQGKTKYIKCKGEFIRLTTYIKEKAKPPAKPVKAVANAVGKTVKISKRVSIIANISEIKDIRTRKLLEKTFKKNAKLYFIKDNKRWKGGCSGLKGGVFTGDITEDVSKNRAIETDKTDLINTLKDSSKITIRKICNLEYRFNIDDNEYIIRPYIKLNNNKIIIELYLSKNNLTHTTTSRSEERVWISLPIHISLFFDINTTGRHSFIHITGEMPQLQKYHISAATNLTVNREKKTHTYLMADNISELLDILKTHGENIFQDWVATNPDKYIDVDEYYNIVNYNWVKIDRTYSGHNIKALDILKCIYKLDKIFLHIFTIINQGIGLLPPIGSYALLQQSSSISVSAINNLLPNADKNYIIGSKVRGTTGTSGALRTSGHISPVLHPASYHRPSSRPHSASAVLYPARSPHTDTARYATRDRSRSRSRERGDRFDRLDRFDGRRASPPRLPRPVSRDRDRHHISPSHLPRPVFRDRSRSRDRGVRR
uniref:Uncharacterized protein n=1 Tax=viral metagenome TaxID=1070528 RepID=A0A6C0CEH5_9ZZZZ